MKVQIEYADKDGEVSTRTIIANKIKRTKTGKITISAHCMSRRAMRSFRGDRILALKDATGKWHDDAVAFLSRALLGMSQNDAYDFLKPYILMLRLIAEADGIIEECELRSAIAGVRKLCEQSQFHWTADLSNRLMSFAMKDKVTDEDLECLDTVDKKFGVFAFNYIMGMVARADGVVTPEEERMIESIKREVFGI